MIIINCLFYVLARKRNAKAVLNRAQKEHLNQITLQLKFQSRQKTIELLRTALERSHKRVGVTQKKVLIQCDDKKINLFPMFNIQITIKDIIDCVKITNKDAVTYIAGESFPPEVIAFASSLDTEIILMNVSDVYLQIFTPAQVFPDISVQYKSKSKLTLSQLRRIIFMRSKAKTYVFLGIIIFITSFIVRFNIYYIVIATVMFSFALLSLFALPSKRGIF